MAKTFSQIGEIDFTHSVAPLRFNHFIGQLSDCHFAAAHALQVIDKKGGCVCNCLSELGQLFSGMNEIRQLVLRQPDRLPSVAFERGLLAHPLRLSPRSRLEKLAATAKSA